ncbi:hypothetical protein [Thalassospira marina]|uniref:Uncharacterized protein n=1 Tax=Thalassospira marina TaxID=2048283 RepID=A0A2N3KYG4_9PROT|nr:hypothetical protein [Thalassospira marina]PKR55601.1 hypothetical protein COO20_05430 [Thalassospira marina]
MSLSAQLLAKHFPVEVILPLAQKYDFDPNNRAIRHLLGRATSELVRHAAKTDSVEQRREDKRELEKALRHLERLERSLKAADVWHGFVPVQDLPLLLRLPRIPTEPPQHLEHLKTERDFLDTGITAFRKWLLIKLSQVTAEPGRPRNTGLQRFTEYMEMIWADELGRPFTVDYHKGKGTTPAFDFVRDMISPVAPPTDSEIVSAMRFVIGELGTHKK